jgi:hypothetical protein
LRVPIIMNIWFQVRLLNFTPNGNESLIRWAIFPAGSSDYISNATAMVSFHLWIAVLSVQKIISICVMSSFCSGYNCPICWTSRATSQHLWELSVGWMEHWASGKTVYYLSLYRVYLFQMTLHFYFMGLSSLEEIYPAMELFILEFRLLYVISSFKIICYISCFSYLGSLSHQIFPDSYCFTHLAHLSIC